MFTICFDTICTGYQPILAIAPGTNLDAPITFNTEAEAQAEIDGDPEFYQDCFTCPLSDIGHKTIFTGKE